MPESDTSRLVATFALREPELPAPAAGRRRRRIAGSVDDLLQAHVDGAGDRAIRRTRSCAISTLLRDCGRRSARRSAPAGRSSGSASRCRRAGRRTSSSGNRSRRILRSRATYAGVGACFSGLSATRISPSAADSDRGVAEGQVDAAAGNADVVDHRRRSRRPGSSRGSPPRPRRTERSVSSMRVPAGARTCRRSCPASTVGKKSIPSSGNRPSESRRPGRRSTPTTTRAVPQRTTSSSAAVDAREALEAAVEALVHGPDPARRRCTCARRSAACSCASAGSR